MMGEDDTLRILVASDIHLGYKEKDYSSSSATSNWADDSFTTFREVFDIARERQADFILLGGDLFHENKPSTKTLYRCMEIFTNACLGDRPCQVQQVFENDQVGLEQGSKTLSTINFQNPNIKTSMPVFSIHGNHDDPVGRELLGAIDLLSVAGYLNYFGKSRTEDDNIAIAPVLLKKGETKIALYGLGHIRDQKLYKMFNKGMVKFLPPIESNEWFKIMVIHQNRVARESNHYIPEKDLPKSLNLIIWGHEHESITKLQGNVLQPGSTVATSLSPSESKKKHVVLLTICGQKSKLKFIELQTVRKMCVKNIELEKVLNLSTSDLTTVMKERKIEQYCEKIIEDLIEEAKRSMSDHPDQPKLPLIRLRIDRSGGYPVFSSSGLSRKFQNRVANADSMIHFLKTSATRLTSDIDELIDSVKIEDFVEKSLMKEDSSSILSASGRTNAVKDFVEKKQSDAILQYCERKIEKTLKYLKENCADTANDCDISAAIARYKNERRDADDHYSVEEIGRNQSTVFIKSLETCPRGIRAVQSPLSGDFAARRVIASVSLKSSYCDPPGQSALGIGIPVSGDTSMSIPLPMESEQTSSKRAREMQYEDGELHEGDSAIPKKKR